MADLAEISIEGSRQMMNKLSRRLPIGYDYDEHMWIWIEPKEGA